MHITRHPKNISTEMNDELALTLTTEPVYKKYFLPGEGAQLPPLHPITTTAITGTNLCLTGNRISYQ